MNEDDVLRRDGPKEEWGKLHDTKVQGIAQVLESNGCEDPRSLFKVTCYCYTWQVFTLRARLSGHVPHTDKLLHDKNEGLS